MIILEPARLWFYSSSNFYCNNNDRYDNIVWSASSVFYKKNNFLMYLLVLPFVQP